MGEQAMQVREPESKHHPMLALVAQRRAFIEPLFANGVTFDEAMSDFGVAFLENPSLGDAKPSSILKAFCLYARLGLRLTLKNHVHLVKYGNDLQLQLGYQGYAELARRTGMISRFKVRAVYDGDAFEVEDGEQSRVHHTPSMDADRTKEPTHYYAMAWLSDGSIVFEWMSKAQVDRVRSEFANDRSPAWKSPHGRVEMAKKTVFIALAKWLPMSPELSAAMDNDPDYDRTDPRAAEIAAAVAGERGEVPQLVTTSGPTDGIVTRIESPHAVDALFTTPEPEKAEKPKPATKRDNGQEYDDLTDIPY